MSYKLCLSFTLLFSYLQVYSNAIHTCTCNRTADSLVLVRLYNSLDGSNWNIKWNLNSPYNSWHGITVDGQFCVKSIILTNNNLTGEIPKEIAQLSNLSSLFLFNNNLFGFLPNELGNLSNLEDLVMENNDLSGLIPESIGNLTQLRLLNLGSNLFIGTIPNTFFNLTRLNQLILSNNKLIGPVSPDFSHLRNLNILDISNNRLSGTIPMSISQLTSLREIYVNGNRLNGTLPSELSQLVSLVQAWFHDNNFTGAVPDFRQSPLNSLRIENNSFDAIPDFSGMRNWGNQEPFGLVIYGNAFTFEDLIPLQKLPRNYYFDFEPQDSIYVDPVVFVPTNSNYTIRLGIDAGLTENNYKWFKDTSIVFISNRNTYEIIQASETDEGIYSCRVSNPGVPDFFLNIKKFRLVLNDLTKCNNPLAANFCSQAPRFCSTLDLHNYCASLSIPDTTIPQFFLCDSIKRMENAKWLSFAATKDSMMFEILPKTCPGVVINGISYKGLQASIWSGCNGIPEHRVYCISDCQENPFFIGGNKIKQGEIYFIALDGCEGDLCDYQIRVTEGKSGFALEEPGSIKGELGFCPDTLPHIYSIRKIPGAKSYHWSINDTIYQITNDTFINIQGLASDTFKLSVYAKNECDSTASSFIVFRIFPKVNFSPVQIGEIGFDSAYIVTYRWSGGVAPFTITKGNGVIDSVRVFRSNAIPCKTSYEIEITDARGCSYLLGGVENCGCNTFAGTMPSDTLTICEGQTIFAKYNNDEIKDTGDVSAFIFYTDVNNPTTSILKNASNGIFIFDPARFRFNIPYYISRASSRALNGMVNFNHPCLSISVPQVVYFRAKPIASAGADKTICKLDGELSAIGNYTSGRWSKVSGPGMVKIDSAENERTFFTADSMGVFVFSWEATNGFCTTKDEIKITIGETIPVNITGKLFVCNGQTTRLDAGTGYKEYFWNNGKQTQSIQADTPGIYCVTVVDNNDCSASACVQLSPSTPPVPVLHVPDSLCTGRKTELNLTQNFEKYIWSTGDTTATVQVDTGMRYCVTVTSENGCTAVDCETIIPKPRSYSAFRDTSCFNMPYFYLGKVYNDPGVYSIIYPDKGRNGCDSAHQLILTWHPEIFIRDSIISHDTGPGNGSIFLRMGGGRPPYDFTWSNGKTTQAIDNLRAGQYSVIVEDANNCIFTIAFIVKLKTNTAEPQHESIPLVVFPNPVEAGSPVQIQIENIKTDVQLSIVQADGKEIWSDVCTINFPHQKNCWAKDKPLILHRAGIYFLYFTTREGTKSAIKLIVF